MLDALCACRIRIYCLNTYNITSSPGKPTQFAQGFLSLFYRLLAEDNSASSTIHMLRFRIDDSRENSYLIQRAGGEALLRFIVIICYLTETRAVIAIDCWFALPVGSQAFMYTTFKSGSKLSIKTKKIWLFCYHFLHGTHYFLICFSSRDTHSRFFKKSALASSPCRERGCSYVPCFIVTQCRRILYGALKAAWRTGYDRWMASLKKALGEVENKSTNQQGTIFLKGGLHKLWCDVCNIRRSASSFLYMYTILYQSMA